MPRNLDMEHFGQNRPSSASSSGRKSSSGRDIPFKERADDLSYVPLKADKY